MIVRVDDAKVATPADISAHLRALRGRPVSVVVVRDRKEINVMLSVISRPERSVGAVSVAYAAVDRYPTAGQSFGHRNPEPQDCLRPELGNARLVQADDPAYFPKRQFVAVTKAQNRFFDGRNFGDGRSQDALQFAAFEQRRRPLTCVA